MDHDKQQDTLPPQFQGSISKEGGETIDSWRVRQQLGLWQSMKSIFPSTSGEENQYLISLIPIATQ